MAHSRVICGFHAVLAALQEPGCVLDLYSVDRGGARLQQIVALAKAQHLAVQPISPAKLDRLTEGATHQGIAARIRVTERHPLSLFTTWLGSAPPSPLILILAALQDPHNIGACLRSADALGVDWVILTQRGASLSPTVSKVATGAERALSWTIVSNLARTLQRMREQGIWVVGTVVEEGTPLPKVDFQRPVALVMGSEDKGLSPLVRAQCDVLATIPLQGTVSSLNVSVATGIGLYECWRQRHGLR